MNNNINISVAVIITFLASIFLSSKMCHGQDIITVLGTEKYGFYINPKLLQHNDYMLNGLIEMYNNSDSTIFIDSYFAGSDKATVSIYKPFLCSRDTLGLLIPPHQVVIANYSIAFRKVFGVDDSAILLKDLKQTSYAFYLIIKGYYVFNDLRLPLDENIKIELLFNSKYLRGICY